MKLTIDFSRLIAARESIGAPLANVGQLHSQKRTMTNPIALRLLETGEVILSKEELKANLKIVAGLLAIGDQQVTLHIYDPFVDKETLSLIPAPRPKFHLYDCTTLENMRAEGRGNRYVPSKNTNGDFTVRPWDNENGTNGTRGAEMQARLQPCINCLKETNYKNYQNSSNKKDIVKDFKIEDFFAVHKHIFRCWPLYTPKTFPEGNYTRDWPEISLKIRDSANWQCNGCKAFFKTFKGLLHCHHEDGNRGNNNLQNIKVLCALCHKQKPFHQNMYLKSSEESKIHQLRKEQ